MNHADSHSSDSSPDAAASGPSALDWAKRAGAVDEVLSELNVRAHRRRRRRRLAVSSLAAVALVAAAVVWRWPQVPAASDHKVMSIVVVAAANRTLPDGSVVDLKDNAEIAVAFTPGVRAVTLLRGTARFQVAKNPNRPFVVTAGDVAVRAVGTAFSVGFESKAVEVIVTEGTVAVAQSSTGFAAAGPAPQAPGTAMVTIGQHVLVEPAAASASPAALAVTDLAPKALAEKMTWLNPRLEFTGTPLEMVVMTFNQHNHRQLVLEDPELRSLQLSGILRSDNIPALLQMLESNFHIRSEPRGTDEIVLHRAP